MFSHFNTNNLCSANRQSNENIYNMPYSLFCNTALVFLLKHWYWLRERREEDACIYSKNKHVYWRK